MSLELDTTDMGPVLTPLMSHCFHLGPFQKYTFKQCFFFPSLFICFFHFLPFCFLPYPFPLFLSAFTPSFSSFHSTSSPLPPPFLCSFSIFILPSFLSPCLFLHFSLFHISPVLYFSTFFFRSLIFLSSFLSDVNWPHCQMPNRINHFSLQLSERFG